MVKKYWSKGGDRVLRIAVPDQSLPTRNYQANKNKKNGRNPIDRLCEQKTLSIAHLVSVKVMDATYLGMRSAHERVWLVERNGETDMAVSSIFDDERSRTSEG